MYCIEHMSIQTCLTLEPWLPCTLIIVDIFNVIITIITANIVIIITVQHKGHNIRKCGGKRV